MICSESCNSSQGGPMMSTPTQKNEALTLRVATDIDNFPISRLMEPTCYRCGNPRSNGSASMCRPCYRSVSRWKRVRHVPNEQAKDVL